MQCCVVGWSVPSIWRLQCLHLQQAVQEGCLSLEDEGTMNLWPSHPRRLLCCGYQTCIVSYCIHPRDVSYSLLMWQTIIFVTWYIRITAHNFYLCFTCLLFLQDPFNVLYCVLTRTCLSLLLLSTCLAGLVLSSCVDHVCSSTDWGGGFSLGWVGNVISKWSYPVALATPLELHDPWRWGHHTPWPKQCHIPRDVSLQQHCWELTFSFSTVHCDTIM